MIVSEQEVEAAIRRLDELPPLIEEAAREKKKAEHKAKVYYAAAFEAAVGNIRQRECVAEQDNNVREYIVKAAVEGGKLAGYYVEKDACQAKFSIWQTDCANNRRTF